MNNRHRLLVIALLFGCSPISRADTTVKIKTVSTDSEANPNVQNPNTLRTVYYRRGMMRRKDGLDAEIVNIANCETKTGFLIDLRAREYRTYKVVKFASEAERTEYLQKSGGRAVHVESKTVDTGERKVFFGYPAKHLITTNRRAPAENNPGGEEIIDGWYIEHEGPDNNCAPDYVRREPYYVTGTVLVVYPEVAQFHHIGPLPMGLAVSARWTVTNFAAGKDGSSRRTITTEKTIEDLSDSPLNTSLFDLPTGFHEDQQLFHTPSR